MDKIVEFRIAREKMEKREKTRSLTKRWRNLKVNIQGFRYIQ